jgi:hypothetical protein
MNTVTTKLIGVAALFLLIFIFGFWLSRSGKPYSPALFNIHKLLSLGALVLIGVLAYRSHQQAALNGAQVTALALMLVCFLVSMITGGLLNLERTQTALKWVHHVIPYLTFLTSAGSLYLLLLALKA